MAVKRKRKVDSEVIDFKLDEVAEKGVICTYNSAKAGFVQVQNSVSGVAGTKVAGLLLIDVVNKDFGAVPVNFQKLETGLSGYVRLMRQGTISTDQLTTATSGNWGVGSGVYLDDNGKITTIQHSTQNEKIGHATGSVDAGFLEIYLNVL